MSDLRLALLGPPLVERDGRPVSFDTRKALALLALLAVTPGDHSRARLAAILWPESDDLRARAALRRTLSVTVAEVGESLLVTRQAVRLVSEAIRVDVWDFQRLLGSGDPGALDRAVRLYRDDFMAGFGLRDSPEFDDWQMQTADDLRQRLAGALEELVEAQVAAGDLGTALEQARRWLALDSLHEPAHQALIRLYGWTGQRSSALRQYRACVGVLDRELGVAPLPLTTALYEQVLAGDLPPPGPSLGLRPRGALGRIGQDSAGRRSRARGAFAGGSVRRSGEGAGSTSSRLARRGAPGAGCGAGGRTRLRQELSDHEVRPNRGGRRGRGGRRAGS